MDNENIKKIYQQFLSEQISKPEVSLEKQKLVARYFEKEPFSVLQFSFFTPALCFAMLFLFFQHLQPSRPFILGPQLALQEPAISQAEQYTQDLEILPVPEKNQLEPPHVLVKSISSHVGPTMVYQKRYNEIPITIVWVFAGASRS